MYHTTAFVVIVCSLLFALLLEEGFKQQYCIKMYELTKELPEKCL